MEPNKIKLETCSKMFEYEKISRDLNTCSDVEILRNICKSYVRLYMKQQETLTCIENTFSNLNN